MPARPIHTERLDLLPWVPAHTQALAQLARTPGVVPSIERNPNLDPAQPETLSKAISHHWEAHGFGWRAISERAAGETIGFVGVTYLGRNDLGLNPSDFELGCWVHPAHWRRGLAAEASEAVIDQAFRELGAPSVMGCAPTDHRASIDGASALGLREEVRLRVEAGPDIVVLRVTAEDWAAARAATARH